jgi:hypothetical protein
MKPFPAVLFGLSLSVSAQTVDTIYHNGSILTMAGSQLAYVEALAVKGGKISVTGIKGGLLKAVETVKEGKSLYTPIEMTNTGNS